MGKGKILIGAGGTAGHLNPAHELAERLLERPIPPDILFAGGNLSRNPFFDRSFPHRDLPTATFSLKRPLKAAVAGWGVWKALKLLRAFRPDVVVGFGSFHAFPLLMAARWRKVPIVLHEGNAYPGRVTRFFSPYASVTGLQFGGASQYLVGKSVPVEIARRIKQAGEGLDLQEGLFTILIFGGSQGAARLNEVASQTLCELAEHMTGLQVIHVTGDPRVVDRLELAYEAAGVRAYVAPYEERLDLAWQAADLAICRAGAGTCSEQVAFGVPAIMVPYPHATDRHQDYNADELQKRGRVVKVDEATLTPESLLTLLVDLLGEGRRKLREMKGAASERGDNFATLIAKVAGWE